MNQEAKFTDSKNLILGEREMNMLDLFSGIGGFRLGAELAGMKFDKTYHSDIDEYANKVYAKHWPESVQLGDITKIDFEELKDGNEFIVTGGFPCQDISIAGRGAGIEGSRSGLWSEMFRAIRILRPKFAIIENVSAITFRGLDRVLTDLAEIGMSAEWQDLRASDMGAPQKRERIWVVAYSGQQPEGMQSNGFDNKWQQCKEKKFGTSERDRFTNSRQNVAYSTSDRRTGQRGDATVKERLQQKSRDAWKLEGRFKGCSTNVADSLHSGLQTQRAEQQTTGTTGKSSEISNAKIERMERSWEERDAIIEEDGRKKIFMCSNKRDGSYKQWAAEPHVGMLVDGLPPDLDRFKGRLTNDKYERKNQLRCLGNSIVPQIAELLFNQIKDKL